ncbi:MAG TPA: hypothetical protein VFN26_17875 [Candidatus Acidoferrum sp.]|nr:hypothetical protein [Candidatus Acidoferrum sp.]
MYNELGQRRINRGAEQEAIDRQPIGSPLGERNGVNILPEPRFAGSEGRAATWTNEDVMRLARQGNREAIQQAVRRGMELPPGARYVMGDPDPRRPGLLPAGLGYQHNSPRIASPEAHQ